MLYHYGFPGLYLQRINMSQRYRKVIIIIIIIISDCSNNKLLRLGVEGCLMVDVERIIHSALIEVERRLELKRRAPLVQCCLGGSWRVESSSVGVRVKNEVAVWRQGWALFKYTRASYFRVRERMRQTNPHENLK